jgi:cytochrome b561
MQLKNSKQRYGLVAIVFHWASALMAIGLLASGFWMTSLSYGSTWYHSAPELHKAFGVMFMGIVLGRLAWKGVTASPEPIGSSVEIKASKFVHLMLYGGLLAMLVSGYLLTTGRGSSIEVFGLLAIPSLFDIGKYTRLAGDVHFFAAWMLLALTAVHALAALKHHFIDRDRVLSRMLGK